MLYDEDTEVKTTATFYHKISQSFIPFGNLVTERLFLLATSFFMPYRETGAKFCTRSVMRLLFAT